MKILETIFLALTVVFFIVGIDQMIAYGIVKSYFLFTFSVLTFLTYGYLKRTREEKAKRGNAK